MEFLFRFGEGWGGIFFSFLSCEKKGRVFGDEFFLKKRFFFSENRGIFSISFILSPALFYELARNCGGFVFFLEFGRGVGWGWVKGEKGE